MTDTPRTDAAECRLRYYETQGGHMMEQTLSYIEPEFARDLERELAAMTAERDEDQSVIAVWRGRAERAEQERDALQADAMRLQWIEENASCIDLFSDPDNHVRVWYGKGGISTSTGRTLAEAADAAIAASKEKP